jgi:hypothetical protein
MFLRSAAPAALLLAATIAAGPPDHVSVRAPSAPALGSVLGPGSAARAKLIALIESAGGTATDEYKPDPVDFPAPVLASIDGTPSDAATPKPDEAALCAAGKIAPRIRKVKGDLTSQGYMVIEGSCFGQSGAVLLGGFPNSVPQVTIEAWTPTAITVQFPKIVGVPDLIMTVTVTHGPGGSSGGSLLGQIAADVSGQASKPVAAKFTAAIGDPIPLPSKYIAMNACGGGIPICFAAPPGVAVGMHVDTTPTSGADIWTFTIPEHWHLHAVHLVHLTPSAASSSTINGSGAQKTIKVAWTETAVQQRADSSAQCSPAALNSLGEFERLLMQQACAANQVVGVLYDGNYRMEPMVRGPAGMTVP